MISVRVLCYLLEITAQIFSPPTDLTLFDMLIAEIVFSMHISER